MAASAPIIPASWRLQAPTPSSPALRCSRAARWRPTRPIFPRSAMRRRWRAARRFRRNSNRAVSAGARAYAPADDSRIGAKYDIPENRRYAKIAILETMMREMPQFCRIEPGVRLDGPAVHGIVDGDKSQIPQQQPGENRRSVPQASGADQQKSDRECQQRRAEAGSFRIRIVWMVVMKLVQALAQGRKLMEDKSVHQIFHQRPGREAEQDQMEPVHTGQSHEDHGGQRHGHVVAEVSDTPHHFGGNTRHVDCSPRWTPWPALSAAFPRRVTS